MRNMLGLCGLVSLGALAGAAGASLSGEPASDPPTPAAGVVATVNGEPIYFEDVERRLIDLHSGQSQTERSAFDLDQLMFRLINDHLLAEEARILGLHQEDPIPARLERLRRNLAVRRLEREEIWDMAQPTEEEIRQAFEREYRTLTFRILTTYEREETEKLLEQVRKGADFESTAREHSVDQYGPRGGLVKNLARIDVPDEVAEVAFDAEPGQLVGPIRTSIGWAIIRVEATGEPEPERLEKLRKQLTELVRLRKAEARRDLLGQRLETLHSTRIDPEAVAAIDCERLPDSRLRARVDHPEAIVARVGGREITAEELGQAFNRRWKGVRNREAALAARPLVLERLVRERLMLAEALRRGYGETPEVERALRAFETQLLVPLYLKEVVGKGIEVTQEEMAAFYDENRDAFRRPPRIHVGQITVADREEAERLAQLLREGADLAWLARRHSIDRFRESGGDRGWIVPVRGVDDLQDRLIDARSGDVLGPWGAPGNFIVARVSTREEQGHYSLEEVAARVRTAVYQQKFARVLDETLQTLRQRSEIVVHEDVLSGMRITGAPIEQRAHGAGNPAEMQ